MVFLRRVALRALSARISSPSLLSAAPRTFVTCTSTAWKPQQRWALSHFQRRFASDEVAEAERAEEDAAEETATETQTEAGLAEETSGADDPIADQQEADAVAAEPETQEVHKPEAAETSSYTPGAAAAAAVTNAASTVASAAQRPFSRPFGEPEHEIPQNKQLYVGNLFFETTEADLKAFFEPFGHIESVRIIHDHRGLSKGFGYVTFEDQESATSAVQSRNQEVFQGRRVTVQYHRPRERPGMANREQRKPNSPSKTLFIGNMSYEMSDKDLNDLFREVRNVLDVRVAIDRRSGQPRGFAHADFIDVSSATKAMNLLREKEVYGRKLRVDYSVSAARPSKAEE